VHRAITDQQHGIRRGRADRAFKGERFQAGHDAEPLGQHDPRERDARARAHIEGQRLDLSQRDAAVEFDAHDRAVSRHARVRNDFVIGVPQDFDRRHQSDVEKPGRQVFGQPARVIQRQFRIGEQLGKPLDERFGI
jgi:hypothetical protein